MLEKVIKHLKLKQKVNKELFFFQGNTPIHDTPHQPRNPNNKREQLPHYHPTNKDGSKKEDGSHYQYPKRQG